MSVYTKTGDKGTTSLYSGERVAKDSLRVLAYGTIDEANAAMGIARAGANNNQVKNVIFELQKNNSLLMADLASVGKPAHITEKQVKRLEELIDDIEAKLPPLKNFLIPGETLAGGYLDLARTIVRRAERMVVSLMAEEKSVSEETRKYVNRLSDLCFVLMRLEENR